MGRLVVPDRDPLTGVPPSRHPFQFFALAACIIAGASSVFDLSRPGTMEELLPEYAVALWGCVMMVGGALGITAGWWIDRIMGLLIERVALGAIAGVTGIYALVLVALNPGISGVPAAFLTSICIASIWRIRHVNRELQTLSEWIERNLI